MTSTLRVFFEHGGYSYCHQRFSAAHFAGHIDGLVSGSKGFDHSFDDLPLGRERDSS